MNKIPTLLQNTSMNQNSNRPQCTINIFGKIPKPQKLFICNTCQMDEKETICEYCASFCHQSHALNEKGISFGYCACGFGVSKCHCFLENPVERDTEIEVNESRQCTFRNTGQNYIHQIGYQCNSCGLTRTEDLILLCCVACSKMCHHEHDQSEPIDFGMAFCDCGDPSQNFHCLLDPPQVIQYPLEPSFYPKD
jgi:hypothetical protein